MKDQERTVFGSMTEEGHKKKERTRMLNERQRKFRARQKERKLKEAMKGQIQMKNERHEETKEDEIEVDETEGEEEEEKEEKSQRSSKKSGRRAKAGEGGKWTDAAGEEAVPIPPMEYGPSRGKRGRQVRDRGRWTDFWMPEPGPGVNRDGNVVDYDDAEEGKPLRHTKRKVKTSRSSVKKKDISSGHDEGEEESVVEFDGADYGDEEQKQQSRSSRTASDQLASTSALLKPQEKIILRIPPLASRQQTLMVPVPGLSKKRKAIGRIQADEDEEKREVTAWKKRKRVAKTPTGKGKQRRTSMPGADFEDDDKDVILMVEPDWST